MVIQPTPPGRPINLTEAVERAAMAKVALDRWYDARATEQADAQNVGHYVVSAIDDALHVLRQARGLITGDLRRTENDQARRVDAFLAERGSVLCLHGEDSRHRPGYGPVEFVGCGCGKTCCAIAEIVAARAVGATRYGMNPSA
jgi:hypothetical protein